MKNSIFSKVIKAISMILLSVTVFTLSGNAITSLTELFDKNYSLNGDQALDICKAAIEQVGNNALNKKNYLEGYCDNFVVDCARAASIGVDTVVSDQGDVNHFYEGLIKVGAKVVTEPKYGDIILYKRGGSYVHAAIYTGGSGLNSKESRSKKYYDSVQGNLGGIVKETFVSWYTDDKGNTVGNGLSVVYIRPCYRNNSNTRATALATNTFNKNANDKKNGEYVLGTAIKYYAGPSDKAETYSVPRMANGARILVTAYCNGFARLGMIKDFRGKSLSGDGREISKTWGAYVKFTDIAKSVFNGNKKSVCRVYTVSVNNKVKVYDSPCAEGNVVTTLKKGQSFAVVAEGVNHVKGHVWFLLSNGLYVYNDSNANNFKEIKIGKATVKSVCSVFRKVAAEASAVTNCNVYQFAYYKNGVYANTVTMYSGRISIIYGVKNSKYTVKARAGIKTYNGTIVWGEWSDMSKSVKCS